MFCADLPPMAANIGAGRAANQRFPICLKLRLGQLRSFRHHAPASLLVPEARHTPLDAGDVTRREAG